MEHGFMKKLAIIFPGVGYHKDKPLLYYSSKLVKELGYDVLNIEYSKLPDKIKGDAAKMKKAAEIAYFDAVTQLKDIDFKDYTDVVFIGKSIGTFTLAKYVSDNTINARQIWYTPVEQTFAYPEGDIIAFIGDADPWSDVDRVKRIASDKSIPLYSYPDCNHSLECEDVDINIANLQDVMKKTKDFIL